MNRRILFACDGVPYWSDAGAWAYNLCARMRREGMDVVHANLIGESDAFFFQYARGDDAADPLALGNVRTCIVEPPDAHEQPALADLVHETAPDLAVAWGALPALALQRAAPGVPLILIANECRQLERLIEEGAVADAANFRSLVDRGVVFPVPPGDPERAAVDACDLLVVTSELARFAFAHFFPRQAGKIYARAVSPAELCAAEADSFAHLRRPFGERDIDVLFAAGDWRPRARNSRLVNRLVARLPDLGLHAIGEHCGENGRLRVHGAPRQRADLYALLGRTRVVACPALFDIGAGVLFEASAMQCNVVASPNCGYADLGAAALRVPHCRVADFTMRLRRAVGQRFPDRVDRFAGDAADLIETLAVF